MEMDKIKKMDRRGKLARKKKKGLTLVLQLKLNGKNKILAINT